MVHRSAPMCIDVHGVNGGDLHCPQGVADGMQGVEEGRRGRGGGGMERAMCIVHWLHSSSIG